MKVKVGNKVYDSGQEAIMVILTDKDKENIANMLPSCTKYCEYQEEQYTLEEIEEWMNDEDIVGRTRSK